VVANCFPSAVNIDGVDGDAGGAVGVLAPPQAARRTKSQRGIA
jgi:hypothetical protein